MIPVDKSQGTNHGEQRIAFNGQKKCTTSYIARKVYAL